MKITTIKNILAVSLVSTGCLHAAAPAAFDYMQILPIILIFAVFYFLIMRPQQKKAKEHQALLQNVHRGDHVVTSSGIIGTIDKIVSDQEVLLEVAEGVKIRIIKSTIASVSSKPQPMHTPKITKKEESSSSKFNNVKSIKGNSTVNLEAAKAQKASNGKKPTKKPADIDASQNTNSSETNENQE